MGVTPVRLLASPRIAVAQETRRSFVWAVQMELVRIAVQLLLVTLRVAVS